MRRTRIRAAFLAALGMTAASGAGVRAAETDLPTIRLSINPLVYAHLPVMVAADKGYFTAEGLKVVITRYPGSSITQIPLVARGDLDLLPTVAGPSLYNQKTEGFDVKVIASETTSMRGWNDSAWLLVRKDLWDSGAIRSIADLRGHAVDAGPDGSPVNVLMRQALNKAGLALTDVQFTRRLATPPDWIAAFRNKAVDALTAVEPIASQIVKQGYAVRLVSPLDVANWSPEASFVANPDYLRQNEPATVRFLKAILHADRDIVEGGPHWSPEIVAILSHWSQMTADDITTIPSPAYYGDYGKIDPGTLAAEEDFWLALGMVKERVEIAGLIDPAPIEEARKEMGIR